jgi:hypothetical protein
VVARASVRNVSSCIWKMLLRNSRKTEVGTVASPGQKKGSEVAGTAEPTSAGVRGGD